MTDLSRRQLLQLGMLGAGSLMLPRWTWGDPTPPEDPHFFLHIYTMGGVDPSYFFDARPLSMTNDGKIQNYLNQDPTEFVGSNGGRCLKTTLTKPLLPFRDRFSVINGMLMSTTFEGHPQNENYLFTGNAFGGEWFIPHLNTARPHYPAKAVDGVQNGFLVFAQTTNSGGIVPLSEMSVGPLTNKLQHLPDIETQTELAAHLRSRMDQLGHGTGKFSAGTRAMRDGFNQISDLRSKLLGLPVGDPTLDTETRYVQFLGGVFRNQVARSAYWSIVAECDTHAPSQAQQQPTVLGNLGQQLGRIFTALTATPYDDKRSLLDVTTVLVSSEFARTMRQINLPMDQTGTDHNPYSNSALIAGKKIRGGMVIGATDFASSDEKLSGAHLQLDRNRINVMGRPFNFKTLAPVFERPATFDLHHYLTVGSVINTIYTAFEVPQMYHRILERNDTQPAPTLQGLLV